MLRSILLGILILGHGLTEARQCSFSEIKALLEAGKSFSAREQSCENELVLVNDRVELLFDSLKLDGLLANGRRMRLKWDAGNIPPHYFERSYRNPTERAYYLETHATCSGDIYNPWYLFGIGANDIEITNFIFEKIPDGLHIYKGTGTRIVSNEFRDVCEDALTIRAGRGATDVDRTLIEANLFSDGDDKVINNESGKVKIVRNHFLNCNKAIDTGNDDVYVSHKRGFVLAIENIFENVEVPMRGSDMGKILSRSNLFKGTLNTLYAARTKGEVLADGDRLVGNCRAMALFTGNPRTVLTPSDPKSKDIPEYQGMAHVRIADGSFNEIRARCRSELNRKTETGKGELHRVNAPLWPLEWTNDFFNQAPDNSLD